MRLRRLSLCWLAILPVAHGFLPLNSLRHHTLGQRHLHLFSDDRDEAVIEEEARLNILTARRNQIRSTLRAAESLRNFRLKNGLVPKLDENGVPIQSDGKAAVALTAFVVAAGAVALRIGGRAALMSAIGLDFVTDNPELKGNLDEVLNTADTMDPATKIILFTAGWTVVKCLCFDAGGVVLALASGILFGGVLQGAVISAAAATFGSSIAFGLAKLETPVRKKALEILEEYPSLRGIEKVVARDGLKAVLTLRLAPILPIPIGMYNYIYGVTNVGFADFAGGIFLGSFKPYLLDSYLGYFGKSLVDGTSDPTGLQDVILLVALGASVLIGVFASQLASETWDSVLEEVQKEKQTKDGDSTEDDGVKKEIFGWELPEWLVGFQYSLKEADKRVRDMVLTEYNAKVWNYTRADNGPPANLDPANFPQSPEIRSANKGIDFAASVCDGLVLSPVLLEFFLKYADPMYKEDSELALNGFANMTISDVIMEVDNTDAMMEVDNTDTSDDLLTQLASIRAKTEQRIRQLDERLKEGENR